MQYFFFPFCFLVISMIICYYSKYSLQKKRRQLIDADTQMCSLLKSYYPVALKKGMYRDMIKRNYSTVMENIYGLYDNQLPAWLPCIQWLSMVIQDGLVGEKHSRSCILQNNKVRFNRRILYCRNGCVSGNTAILNLVDVATELMEDASINMKTLPLKLNSNDVNFMIGKLIIVEYLESLEWNAPVMINYIETTPFYFTGDFIDEKDLPGCIRRYTPSYRYSYEEWLGRITDKSKREGFNWSREIYSLRSRLFEWGRE